MHLNSTCIAFVLTLMFIQASYATEPERFLGRYCTHCHGAKRQESDRRFDDLPNTISSARELERFQEIVDQLNLQAMPPEDATQPSQEERAALIERISSMISQTRNRLGVTSSRTVLRRLNAWEYRHTIGDMLGFDVTAWDPTENFPQDERRNGFDNNGAALVTSSILLGHYLNSAETAIRRATHFDDPPESRHLVQQSPFYFEGKAAKKLPKLFQVDRFRFIPDTPYTDLYGRHYRGGHLGFLPTAVVGVPHSGNYTIRVRAAAIDRRHDYGKALGDFRNGDPLVMELAAVDRRGSAESTGNVSKMISLRRVELTSDQPQWIEWTGYLEQGFEPEVRFRNGPLAAKRMVRLLTSKVGDRPEFRPFADLKPGAEKAHGVLRAYQGPKLRVWEIQLNGPHVDEWPPHGHKVLYGNVPKHSFHRDEIQKRLRGFAETAFRRPVELSELEPIEELVERQLETGQESVFALQLGLQAILCAPQFLYLHDGSGRLDDFTLASRLSYFLWSSLPDQRLLDLAASGSLSDKEMVGQEVERMLADAKSRRFVTHFVRRWLDTENIGEMPPSDEFLAYYRDNLGNAMQQETESFFGHVLTENLPVDEFLTADYSFLNRELALHYGIEGIIGNQMRRVSLEGTSRGGLLGHGLFLTASANGVDTSPVTRGMFVQQKLLGYTPPSPPPDVPAIEPDIRNARTIREQLAKHRELSTCAACHKKIDPFGFALENFDAVGAWRDEYDQGLTIDSHGSLPGGDHYQNVAEFRRLINERRDQFARNLVQKLFTYALGRDLDVGDRPAIDNILHQVSEGDGGFRSLIKLIATSDVFLKN